LAQLAQHKIVLLETDQSRRDSLRSMISGWGYVPFIFENERNCLANLPPLDPDLVISGNLSTEKALRFISSLKIIKNNLPVLILSKNEAVQELIDANEFSNVRLVRRNTIPAEIKSAIIRTLDAENYGEGVPDHTLIIGKSPAMVRIKELIATLNSSKEAVLVLGETGTGKELVARAIHRRSERKNYPFVIVNSVELPYRLLEGELFGYPSVAIKDVPHNGNGMFAFANKGTIFFKEIGALPTFLQAKLIQYLEEAPRSGEESAIGEKTDVCLIASTTKNLSKLVQCNEFRTDLYYRMNVIRIKIPSLRERTEDIPLLIDFFTDKYCIEFGKSRFKISEKTRSALIAYHWPENVKELERLIRRVVLKGSAESLVDHFLAKNSNSGTRAQNKSSDDIDQITGLSDIKTFLQKTNNFSLKSVRREFMVEAEKRLVKKALEMASWNRKKAAELLDISYKSLLNKMKAFKIT